MLEIRDKSASTLEVRKQNISSWQEASITRLNSKAKKRFSKNKSAIIAYFTGDKPIEEIATQYNLSTGQLLKMTENCLKQHEDGSPWGYRALLPGVLVKDHASRSAPEQTEVQDATIDSAPAIQEPEKQEQVVDDQDNLKSTAKRRAITTTPTDAPEETPVVAVVPAQPADSNETDSIDHLQNQAVESSPIPVSESSEVASSEVATKNAQAEISDQADETGFLSPENVTLPDETAISGLDASSPSDDIDTQSSASESGLTSAAAEVPVTEPEVTPDTTEVSATETNATTHRVVILCSSRFAN